MDGGSWREEERVKRVEGEVERVEGSEAERAKFKIYEHVSLPSSSSLRLFYKIDPTSFAVAR